MLEAIADGPSVGAGVEVELGGGEGGDGVSDLFLGGVEVAHGAVALALGESAARGNGSILARGEDTTGNQQQEEAHDLISSMLGLIKRQVLADRDHEGGSLSLRTCLPVATPYIPIRAHAPLEAGELGLSCTPEILFTGPADSSTILIVDDAEINRRMIRAMLQGGRSGQSKLYKLLECRRPSEALAIVSQEKVDLVICEFMSSSTRSEKCF